MAHHSLRVGIATVALGSLLTATVTLAGQVGMPHIDEPDPVERAFDTADLAYGTVTVDGRSVEPNARLAAPQRRLDRRREVATATSPVETGTAVDPAPPSADADPLGPGSSDADLPGGAQPTPGDERVGTGPDDGSPVPPGPGSEQPDEPGDEAPEPDEDGGSADPGDGDPAEPGTDQPDERAWLVFAVLQPEEGETVGRWVRRMEGAEAEFPVLILTEPGKGEQTEAWLDYVVEDSVDEIEEEEDWLVVAVPAESPEALPDPPTSEVAFLEIGGEPPARTEPASDWTERAVEGSEEWVIVEPVDADPPSDPPTEPTEPPEPAEPETSPGSVVEVPDDADARRIDDPEPGETEPSPEPSLGGTEEPVPSVGGTQEPVPSGEPVPSEDPGGTEDSVSSVEPVPSVGVTQEPVPSEDPVSSEEPGGTEESVSSVEPDGTVEPPSEEPVSSEEPGGTEQPVPPEQPVPSEEPTATDVDDPEEAGTTGETAGGDAADGPVPADDPESTPPPDPAEAAPEFAASEPEDPVELVAEHDVPEPQPDPTAASQAVPDLSTIKEPDGDADA